MSKNHTQLTDSEWFKVRVVMSIHKLPISDREKAICASNSFESPTGAFDESAYHSLVEYTKGLLPEGYFDNVIPMECRKCGNLEWGLFESDKDIPLQCGNCLKISSLRLD